MPRNLAEALLTHDRDEVLTFHTHPASGGRSWEAIFGGHGVGIDDQKDDLLRYFQRIDRALHPLLREERAPLILAAVQYLLPIYREASTYPPYLRKECRTKDEKGKVQEYREQECYESVALPAGIDKDKIEAKYRKRRAHAVKAS